MIVVLTQLSINNGEKLFSTGYRDPPFDSEYRNTACDADSDDDDDEDNDGPTTRKRSASDSQSARQCTNSTTRYPVCLTASTATITMPRS